MGQTLTLISTAAYVEQYFVPKTKSHWNSFFMGKKKILITLRISISNEEYINPFLMKHNVLFSSYYENTYSKTSVYKKKKLCFHKTT